MVGNGRMRWEWWNNVWMVRYGEEWLGMIGYGGNYGVLCGWQGKPRNCEKWLGMLQCCVDGTKVWWGMVG